MTVLDLAPLDARSLLAQARRLLAAWREELAAVIPQRLRLRVRPSLEAEPLADGRFRLTRHGRELVWTLRRGRPAPVTLRASAGAVLVCEAQAPEASDSDIVRMLSLDVDRLTPFDTADVFTAVALAPRRLSRSGRRALVGVIPKTDALDVIARARAAGLEPRAMVAAEFREGFPPLDFTPSMGALLMAADGSRTRLLWMLAVLLAAIDLAVVLAQDVTRTRELRAELAALRPRVVVAQRLRARVLAEEGRRSEIIVARKRAEPLRRLDEVSRYLPDGAWVERFSWNGQTIRISGYRREGVDVTAALRSAPDFTDARNVASDVGGSAASGIPFDLSIQVRPPQP
ncbi:MAG TPA: PilN domain-containing protein [Caulobacteraceae bacterium]|jgi:PAS domain-containing protein